MDEEEVEKDRVQMKDFLCFLSVFNSSIIWTEYSFVVKFLFLRLLAHQRSQRKDTKAVRAKGSDLNPFSLQERRIVVQKN